MLVEEFLKFTSIEGRWDKIQPTIAKVCFNFRNAEYDKHLYSETLIEGIELNDIKHKSLYIVIKLISYFYCYIV
jgi:hypothetical protein